VSDRNRKRIDSAGRQVIMLTGIHVWLPNGRELFGNDRI